MIFEPEDAQTWTAWRLDRLVAVLERLGPRKWLVDDQNGFVCVFPRRRDAINCILAMPRRQGSPAIAIDSQHGDGFEYKATGPDDIGLLPPQAFDK